ncbi:MAG: hypothetical protein ACRDGN_03495 [bacterium]
MVAWLQAWLHTIVYEYVDNERGQDAILWIIIALIIFLIVTRRSVVVQ